MATYAIGDIQGCFDSLQRLLAHISFDPERDRLWLVGDLVNRGPRSLDVLRWARDLGDRVVTVLGNHDMRLLSCAAGAAKHRDEDTLLDVLYAPDRDALIEWLRHRPLIHVEDRYAMVHAGLHPAWSIADAVKWADEVTALLRGDDWREQIGKIYVKKPPRWSGELSRHERIQATASVLLTIRTCRKNGKLCRKHVGPPENAPDGCEAWFAVPEARWRERCVIFGHWSTLGLRLNEHYIALDSGCVWGQTLSAVRLDDRKVVQIPAAEPYRALY